MKRFSGLLFAAVSLVGFSSCQPNDVGLIPGAGYSPRDSYMRGFGDGSSDQRAGKTHNPHISRSDTLPSAHRNEYVWGYNEGYKSPFGQTNYVSGAFSK